MKRVLLFVGFTLLGCGSGNTAAPAPHVDVPPPPASTPSTDPPRQKIKAENGDDPEAFARAFFEAAFHGDEAGARQKIASFDEVHAALTREMTEAEYAEKVRGYLHDIVAQPNAEASIEVSGVKVIQRTMFTPKDNEKVRRQTEVVVVRPVVKRGDREGVMPFNFVMMRTPEGWRFFPGE